MRCRCRAAHLSAGKCLADAMQCLAHLCLAFASLRNARATPVWAMPPRRGPFRCHAPLRCRLCPAHAFRSLRNHAPALPLHSWPMRRSAYRCPCSAQHCRSITELISASAAHSQAPAAPCQASPPPDFGPPGSAKPPRIIAPLWLAAAIHGLTVPCRCQAGQCIAVPSLCDADFTLPLRRTPRIAAALLDALPLRCMSQQSYAFAWPSMLYLATAPPSCAKP